MPKTRLQTQWDVEGKSWKIFTSIDAGSQGPAIDIKDIFDQDGKIIPKEEDRKTILDPTTDKAKIAKVLKNDSGYEIVKARKDHNEIVAVTQKGKQQSKPGFYAESAGAVIGASAAIAIIGGIIGFTFNTVQYNQDHALSFRQAQIQSGLIMGATAFVGSLATAVALRVLAQKKHNVINAENAYEINKGLLGRLDDIEKKVQLKNKVLRKIGNLLDFNWENTFNNLFAMVTVKDKEKATISYKDKIKNAVGHALDSITYKTKVKTIKAKKQTKKISCSYKDKIIEALDREDDLGCWQSVDTTLGMATDKGLEFLRPHIVRDIKYAFLDAYDSFLDEDEKDLVKQVNSLEELFDHVRERFSDSERFVDKKLPIDFIFSCFRQTLQNRERLLAEEMLKEIFSEAYGSFQSSSSKSESMADQISKEMNKQYKIDPEAAKASFESICKLTSDEQTALKNFINHERNPIENIIHNIMDQYVLKDILAGKEQRNQFSQSGRSSSNNTEARPSSPSPSSLPFFSQEGEFSNAKSLQHSPSSPSLSLFSQESGIHTSDNNKNVEPGS